MKNGKYLNVACVSDIHLGNRRVPTDFIIENLKKAFPNTPATGELDILFLAGDVFDRALQFPDKGVRHVQRWVHYLLSVCSRWDIKLRVLEGTPSHDRGQSEEFEIMAGVFGRNLDCKYISRLSIEKMDDLGISILYIPDEWRPDNNDTWLEVKQELSKENLESVDFSIMHGMFEHQLPKGIELPCHSAANYESITKRYVFIGHVHKSSRKGKILAQGSFDRLSHNEEEDKGHFRVKSYNETPELDEVTFMVNENAKRFVTYDISGLDLNEAEVRLSGVKNLPDGSFVRLVISNTASQLSILSDYRDKYPNLIWETKKVSGPSNAPQITSEFLYSATPTTPETILPLMQERLNATDYPQSMRDTVVNKLKEIMDEERDNPRTRRELRI